MHDEHDLFDERQVVVDLAAIRANVREIARRASPAAVMAMVKANAYGHGTIPVAQAAVEAGAHWLGVARVCEALELRRGGLVSIPILAYSHTSGTDFAAAIGAGITLGISGWELPQIAAAARTHVVPAQVHMKVDTGMCRNGISLELFESILPQVQRYQDEGVLKVTGIFSHLAVAEEPDREETDTQLACFHRALALTAEAGIEVEVRHLANTAATYSRPDTHFDLVRAGLGIYGLSPFPGQSSQALGLSPAMTLKATVSLCRDVPAGQGISYGLRYHTKEAGSVALIPLGYGDGLPREASGALVRIDGGDYPVVGRIMMDQFVVDLGSGHRVAAGADVRGREAVLFGPDGPSVDQWASAAGTITNEIITSISPRLPRYYLNARPEGARGEGGAATAVEPDEGAAVSEPVCLSKLHRSTCGNRGGKKTAEGDSIHAGA